MDKLKEKVFGLAVVVVLGVIFIPMLFNENVEATDPQNLSMAPSSAKPQKPPVLAQIQEPVSMTQEEEIPPSQELPSQPALILADSVSSATPSQAMPPPKDSNMLDQPQLQSMPSIPPVEEVSVVAPIIEETPVAAPVIEAAPVAPVIKAAKSAPLKTEMKPVSTKAPKLVKKKAKKKPPKNVSKKGDKKAVKVPSAPVAKPEDWSIQLGTFAFPEKAAALVKSLKTTGHSVYTKKILRQGRTLTVVLVACDTKADALRLKPKLEQKYQLQAILVQ